MLLAHRQLQLACRIVTLARPQPEAILARALVGRHLVRVGVRVQIRVRVNYQLVGRHRRVGSHGVLGARTSRRVARLVRVRVRVRVTLRARARDWDKGLGLG